MKQGYFKIWLEDGEEISAEELVKQILLMLARKFPDSDYNVVGPIPDSDLPPVS